MLLCIFQKVSCFSVVNGLPNYCLESRENVFWVYHFLAAIYFFPKTFRDDKENLHKKLLFWFLFRCCCIDIVFLLDQSPPTIELSWRPIARTILFILDNLVLEWAICFTIFSIPTERICKLLTSTLTDLEYIIHKSISLNTLNWRFPGVLNGVIVQSAW